MNNPAQRPVRHVIFDLGGVVFRRDPSRRQELMRFFAFLKEREYPDYWVDFDRGLLSQREVAERMALHRGCSADLCDRNISAALALQQEVPQTKALIAELRQRGYGVYCLSNMSAEFYRHLLGFEVMGLFDGIVMSCEEHTVKPERRIYEILLDRYGLDPAEALFADDREANLRSAETLGIRTVHFTDPESGCRRIRLLLGLEAAEPEL